MKLFSRLFVLIVSAANLPASAAIRTDLLGEPARAPSLERAIITAVPDRTITIDDKTKWVNVAHYEVVRFVSNGREFTWYFDGVAQPGAFDLMQIAPEGFVNHGVAVYVSLSERDLPL